ncbi:gamma-glutamylcyclotransferase family protein [Desulfofustis limnaeus]|jgi:gamma-glutamylcyclotransferase (GGCT)/AIG2-like uncharacterized protein YtfP|uniref:Putative gamma-glutamylcyclotransferase n=1 Tax=Desulfofustis limnaeus TaxID=2740163 RepID=A0ABM7W984_9BACT|nr:gamma-glutamylcyclotransferase family protein [Desulfofustis limnaeus]MDX9894882.1 gamma-glutamylcyclotransferase family protein [Desulfofustis sp.]BDD87476.1 hypothetical protein DPPLL_18410 [Desulfofustis limnaeus]
MHLFTYGSLMFPAVWQRVAHETYHRRRAVLPGYFRRAVKGATYPVVYPATTTSEVEGVLYYQVTDDDLKRLDRFEGDYYQRRSESVRLSDGQLINAEVYVLKEEFRFIASDHDWDQKRFEQEGLSSFLSDYLGFDKISSRP